MSRTAILIVAATACLTLAAVPHAYAQRTNRSVSRPSLNPYSAFMRAGSELYDPTIARFLPQSNQITRRQSNANTSPTSSALLGGSSMYGLGNPELDRARTRI